MVERIYRAVEASGELDNTVIVFTSDNGFFHGEHRVPKGKERVYDEAIRVPLIVRGPGFAPGLIATEPVINADLAPTFVALSGATPGRVMDGRSLLDRDPSRPLLIEAGDVPAPFTAVRTTSWEWVEYQSGERELYDLTNDPVPAHEPPRRPNPAAPRRHSLPTCSPGCAPARATAVAHPDGHAAAVDASSRRHRRR